jgi:hypothetical protein
MAKIYVRERTNVGKGAGRPRFAVVAVEGTDLRFYTQHMRKIELEKLAETVGAELVYLPRGEKAGEEGGSQGRGGKRRRRSSQE